MELYLLIQNYPYEGWDLPEFIGSKDEMASHLKEYNFLDKHNNLVNNYYLMRWDAQNMYCDDYPVKDLLKEKE